ncbi:TetR family transcriptional regulator, partial [Acinetobacter nosocomialis]
QLLSSDKTTQKEKMLEYFLRGLI